MTDSTTPRSTAVEQLTEFGLSTYAARTYVALSQLETGTAGEVSEIADVPRTRVYDAARELADRGLVDVQQSEPRRFWAVSIDTAVRLFWQEYERRTSRLTDALEQLGTAPSYEEQRGVWTVTDRESVENRVLDFVEAATEEVVYTTVDELLTDEIVSALRATSERGVDVKIGGISQAAREQLKAEVPEIEVFETLWDPTEMHAGRLLMVDKSTTLVSVLLEGNGNNPPEPFDERAIWGKGETNGLVVVLRAMFTWELDDSQKLEDRDEP
jgi:sugar-specific transcriptional regulator TrmB